MSDLVTVIIPVYNVEKYLDRCLDSVVGQTYTNLEILLIDDGSPDRCPQMCDEWEKKDSRIKVIHKQNAGLGMARNTGMEHATGDYICFVDSDDYLAKDTIALAQSMARKKQADVVLYGITYVDHTGCAIKACAPETTVEEYNEREVQEDFLPALMGEDPKTGTSIGLPLSVCCMMFSRNLTEKANWKFISEREIISEDNYAILELFRDVNCVAVLKQALYHYCDNNASLSRTYRPDRYAKNKRFYLQCIELCKRCGYSERVIRRCTEPFLGNTMAAMKQEVTHCSRTEATAHLRSIIDDDLLQSVLRKKRGDKTNLKKRILYWAIRNKQYGLCYVLLAAKNAAAGK